jgi:ankyrin repeat protein|tara:strand:+ start:168 stop:773 length:606 start_codon:yes stop_codon:yes gene_type:complete
MKSLLYNFFLVIILASTLSILTYAHLTRHAETANIHSHPLIKATKEGNVSLVTNILERGTPVDTTDWAGWTSMHWAALLLKNDVIKVLLDAGADIEKIGKGGKNSGTPLMMAAKKYNGQETIKILLMNGADVNGSDQYGRTALIIASRYGRKKTVQILLDSGADVTRISTLRSWRTALQVAKHRGHQSIVNILREAGARNE